jgi:hypothetical protein
MKLRILSLLLVLGPSMALAQEDTTTEAEAEEAEPEQGEPEEAEPAPTAPDKVVETPKDKADLVLTEIWEEIAEPPEDEGWEFDFTLIGGSGLPFSKFGSDIPRVHFERVLPSNQAEVGFAMLTPFTTEKTDAFALRYSQDRFSHLRSPYDANSGSSVATVDAVTGGGENVQFEVPVTLGPLAIRPFVQSLAGGYRFQWDEGKVGHPTYTELGKQNGRWKFGYESDLGLNIGPNPERWHRAVTPSLVFRYDLVDIESDLVLGHMIVSGLILGIPVAAVQLISDAMLEEKPMLRDSLKIASQAASAFVGHTLLHDSHNWPWADPPTLAYERPVAALRFDW